MRVFRLLGARRLRQQPLRAAIAGVAVGAGVALAVAILVTTASIDGSLRDFGRTLAGPADLRIVGATSHGALTADAVDAAAAVDGVAEVVPIVQQVSWVDEIERRDDGLLRSVRTGDRVLVLGVDCRAEALFGDFGCDQAALDAAGDRPLAMSEGLGNSLRTDTGRVDLTGVPTSAQLSALGSGRTVLLSLTGAQQRFDRPLGADVAYVVPDDGADLAALRTRLETAVGDQHGVLTGDEPPPVVAVALSSFLPLFTLLGLFGLGTGAVLVRNTVTLSLEERRRQLAILGALGARSSTVVGGAVGEAALLGAAGGLAGTFGGIVLAGPIVDSLSGFTESLVGVPLTRHVTGGVVVIGLVLGTAVAALAAVLPARRAMRLDVAAELSGRGRVEEATPLRVRRRLVVSASVFLAGLVATRLSNVGGGLEPWQAVVGPVGFLVAAIGALVVSANLAPIVIGRLARATRGTRRGTVLLSIANLVRDPRRSGILAVAIASPIIVGFVTDGFVQSARTGIADSFDESGDFVSVSTIDPNEGGDAFLAPDVVAAIDALSESGQVHRGGFLSSGTERDELLGVQGYTELRDGVIVLDGELDEARFAAGEVLIGPALARRTGARAGDNVSVDTPTGTVEVPVLAVVAEGDFGGRGIDMAYDRFETLFGPVPPSYISIEPAAGVTEVELRDAIRDAVQQVEPLVQVRTSDEIAADVADSVAVQMTPFRVLQQGLLFVAFVAVLSNLLLVGMQRTRETGLLAAIGAAPPDLRKLVLAEAGTVGGVAVAQSAVFGPVMLWATIQLIPVLIGFRDPYRPAWGSLLVGGTIAVGIALVASAWPAWRASRVEVLEALRYE